MKIETDAYGVDVIWGEQDGRPVALQSNEIFVNVGTGHVFRIPVGLRGVSRIAPHEVEMVNHFLEQNGELKPVVFSGDPVD